MAKWNYIIIDEYWTVSGTNDKSKALQAAEFEIVIDVQEGVQLDDCGDTEEEIPEFGEEEEEATDEAEDD